MESDHAFGKVEFGESSFLNVCSGETLINKNFRGFVSLTRLFVINDKKLAHEHLRKVLIALLDSIYERISEREPVLDENGKPIVDKDGNANTKFVFKYWKERKDPNISSSESEKIQATKRILSFFNSISDHETIKKEDVKNFLPV